MHFAKKIKEVVVLMGKTGSGKSTIINGLTGK